MCAYPASVQLLYASRLSVDTDVALVAVLVFLNNAWDGLDTAACEGVVCGWCLHSLEVETRACEENEEIPFKYAKLSWPNRVREEGGGHAHTRAEHAAGHNESLQPQSDATNRQR